MDDEVLPRLSLAVEGLTGTTNRARRLLEVAPDDGDAAPPQPSATLPHVALDPEQLEVYGWETTFWRKLRGYLGF